MANVLVVDDTPANLELLSIMLKRKGYSVRCVINGSLALKEAQSGWPELILLDIKMPEMDGYQVCQYLKVNENTSEIPVIFLSALDDAWDKVQAFAVGGVDYITKPFQIHEIIARVKMHLQLQNFNKTLKEQVEERTTQLKEALIKAEAANRAKSTFLANMSHELRTPLNAIIGYSEILQEESLALGKEEVFGPDLEKINFAAHHLLEIINNVLDLSKIDMGKMELNLEQVNINSIVKDVIARVKPLIEEGSNNLVINYSQQNLIMYTDVFKVCQSLFNILSNANKFTEQGTIALTVSYYNKNKQDWVRFCVRDSGIGIASEQIKQLFQAFTQVDGSSSRKYNGAGLGLVVAKQFCQMMGGDISVESEIGKGSQFTINLPAKVSLS